MQRELESAGEKDEKEEEGADRGARGSEAPTPSLPFFLPGLFWSPQPLTTRVGEIPTRCVQDVGPRDRPEVRRGGKDR